MTKTTKMTKKDYFETLKASYPVSADNYQEMIDFIDREIALLKPSKNGPKAKAKAAAADKLTQAILSIIGQSSKPVTATDIMKALQEQDEYAAMSVSKVNAHMRDCVDRTDDNSDTDRPVKRTVVKGRAYFEMK